jgi:16S rRNA C967 or C1407 C5-methylase (RsmB/RsmF family)
MTRTKQRGRRHGNRDDRDEGAKDRKRQRSDTWKSNRGDSSSYTLTLTNKRFEAFYQAIGFVPEAEWDDFMSALRRPLPACFHMDPAYAFTEELKSQLFAIVKKISDHEVDGASPIPPLEVLPWYPHGCGFKLGVDRRSIRKDESLTDLHKWMIQHTDNGNITRQEAVSMVPPLALNVLPHHKCLDMCAAPGSKTSQLLEIVSRSMDDAEECQGLVVANDSDTSRAYMLVHQCRRLKTPLLLVTTHKGQNFPYLSDTLSDGTRVGIFDRVLCDVPCSGDGTLRKNPEIWSKWSSKNSIGLHGVQLHIANRGILLLKPGGLMVYSTCSMSPYGKIDPSILRAKIGNH